MLLKLIKTEQMKLKRSPIWLAFIIIPIIPAILGTLNYVANIEILQKQWFSLWTQHTLFTDFFFLPIMLGVYCSYIVNQEEKNHNWNKVLTMPLKRSEIFIAKLITSSLMVALSIVWICMLFVISGKLAGITAPIPFDKIIIWCIFGILGGGVMVAIQLIISIFIKSFALPVGIALAGGISGLYFLSKHMGHIYPYSLMAYGMNSNSPQELMETGYLSFIIVCVFYLILFITLGSCILQNKES